MRFDFIGFSTVGRAAATLAVAAAMTLAATSPSSSQNFFQRLFGGGGQAQKAPDAGADALTIDPYALTAPSYCPEVRLAVGSEAWAAFAANHDGDQKYVRYLGSVSQTARECHFGADPLTMSIKVGIAGRVVAGPIGAAGKVTLPFRVTVLKQNGSKVLYDKKYSMSVNVTAPTLSADFSDVIDPITFKRSADDEDLIVYVGFDVSTRVGPG